VTLSGRGIVLQPLDRIHTSALTCAGSSPEIWEFFRAGPCQSEEAMRRLVETLLQRQGEGTDLPLTICKLPDRTPIGMTRFLQIDRANRTVEIGGTWLDRTLWRTPVNTESKFLMLQHAFETESVNRVQLLTDERNLRSQRAIERIGGQREGVLREHVVLWNGYVRSSVVYSILANEWPGVRLRLEAFLSRPWPSPGPAGSS